MAKRISDMFGYDRDAEVLRLAIDDQRLDIQKAKNEIRRLKIKLAELCENSPADRNPDNVALVDCED